MYRDTKITEEELDRLPENDRVLALFDNYFKQTESIDLPEFRDTYFIKEDTTNIIEPNISHRTILDFPSKKEAEKYISKNLIIVGDNMFIYNKDKGAVISKKEVRNLVKNDESIDLLLRGSIIVPVDNWIYTE